MFNDLPFIIAPWQIMEAATALFNACEQGKGWDACKEYATVHIASLALARNYILVYCVGVTAL